MISTDEEQVAQRIDRLRGRRRACLLAARIGLVGLGLLGIGAVIIYARVGSLPIWFSLAWVGALIALGVLLQVELFTACPRCNRDPHGGLRWSLWLWPASVCKQCGLDLYSEPGRES